MTTADPWHQTPALPEQHGRSREPDELVWHYTGQGGFDGIVSSSTIWATSTDSLNDTGEGAFGVTGLREAWAALRINLIDDAPDERVDAWLESALTRFEALDAYVVCGCINGDSLTHWRSYTGGRGALGYAIGFRSDAEFHALAPASSESLYLPDSVPALLWRDINYRSPGTGTSGVPLRDPYARLIDAALDCAARARDGRGAALNDIAALDRALTMTVLSQKHDAYFDECEARLVVVGAPGYSWTRNGTYGAQSVITLTGHDGSYEKYSTTTTVELPIERVLLGPWNPPGDVERVRVLLDSAGYPIPITQSKIPIR